MGVRKEIEEERYLWKKFPWREQRDFQRCEETTYRPWLLTEHFHEKVGPGRCLVLDSDDDPYWQKIQKEVEADEKDLTHEDYLQLVLIKLWWEKLKHQLVSSSSSSSWTFTNGRRSPPSSPTK